MGVKKSVPILVPEGTEGRWPFGVHARHRFQNSPPGSHGIRPCIYAPDLLQHPLPD